MTLYLAELALMLVVILVAAELFTNALEHLGERLHISEGVTGSLFAAVGTALPETMVPLLALVVGSNDAKLNEEVGVGAILGAPLMLSTLSIGVMAFSVLKSRGLQGYIRPESRGFQRDMNFFLFAFALAALAMFIPHDVRYGRAAVGVVLVLIYIAYIVVTMRASAHLVASGHGTEAGETMFLTRMGLPLNMPVIIGQMLLALVLLVLGAKGFIYGVEGVAHTVGISALLLSLLIIPIATELPEKINSVLWIRKDKDTLAIGNITGAMVFQGTLLPAIGIMLTPWEPHREVLSGVIVTLMAAVWIRLHARASGVRVWMLLVNGLLYCAYLAYVLI